MAYNCNCNCNYIHTQNYDDNTQKGQNLTGYLQIAKSTDENTESECCY